MPPAPINVGRVLGRINGLQDHGAVDLFGQRQLHQDAIDAVIGIQARDHGQQFRLRGGVREAILEGTHAGLDRAASLAAHIDFTGRIVADKHHRQSGLDAIAGFQFGHTRGDVAPQVRCHGFAIDDLGSHRHSSLRFGSIVPWSVAA
jgi:hypothetical protein